MSENINTPKYNCIELSVGNTDFLILFGTDFHFKSQTWTSPVHYHLFCECHFLKSGTFLLKTEDKSEVVNKDTFFVIPVKLKHNIETLAEPVEDISFYVVISENRKTDLDTFGIFKDIFLSGVPFIWQKSNTVFRGILELVRDQNESPLYELKLKNMFSLALAELLEQTGKKVLSSGTETPLRYREEVVLKIENFMLEAFSPDATLEELADYLCLSVRQTDRLLKQVFNSTFQEIKNQKRIENAKRLIENTDLSLTEISEKAGYNSYAGFHKMFCRQTGKSPQEYRNEMKNIS